MEETAIRVDNLSKTFKLPHERAGSVKNAVVGFWKRDKRFEKQKVLKDISFEIKKGEFFGIVGRNGSGKSTLLKLLAGIYTPDKGLIQVNGKLTPFIELGVGFNPELTGRENVYLNGALLGFNRKETTKMYEDIVKFAELGRFMDQKLKNYSSGMQVRLAFSIAIRAKSDILLIDEVLAVGDAIFQQKCLDFFKEIKGSKTILFISHDMRSVERFCDRVMIINDGSMIDTGKATDMIYKYGAILTDTQNDSRFESEKKDKGTHQGTGRAVIYKVEVLNKKKKPVKTLNSQEKFSLRIHYKCRETINNPVFIASIFDSGGTKLISSTTEMSKVDIKEIKEGYVDLSILNNPLAAGKYNYNVGIFGPNMIVAHDHFKDAGEFTINGSNWGGFRVELDNTWSIQDKA